MANCKNWQFPFFGRIDKPHSPPEAHTLSGRRSYIVDDDQNHSDHHHVMIMRPFQCQAQATAWFFPFGFEPLECLCVAAVLESKSLASSS